MAINLTEDIRSVTDLKRNMKAVLSHVHKTRRPVVLTVNGKADAVLMDAGTYQKHLEAGNLSKLLAVAEQDVQSGRIRPARSFLKEFKNARKIQG
jgi:prevent-host-death family protein